MSARRLLACVAVAGACALAPAAAEAAQGFVPLTQVGGPALTDSSDVAVDSQGDTFAIWREAGSPAHAIFVSIRPAGGTFGPPQRLDDGAAGSDVDSPHIAVDAAGDAVAVWNQSGSGNNTIVVRKAAAQPAFDTANRLSLAGGSNATDPRVVMSPGGDAIVLRTTTSTTLLLVARIALAGQAFGGDVGVSSAADSATNGYDLAIGPNGDAVVAWGTSSNPNFQIRYAIRNPGGTTFTSNVIIGSQNSSKPEQSPAVAVDATGRAVVVWYDSAAGRLTASVRPAGGTFENTGTPIGPVSTQQSDVGMDSAGNAWAVWRESGGIMAARLPAAASSASGFVLPPQTVVSSPVVSLPVVAMSAGGTAVAAWRVATGQTFEADGAFAPPGGAFTAAQALSTGNAATGPHASLDSAGDGAVDFPSQGSPNAVGVRGFDSSPPQLMNVNVPANAMVGQAVPVSVNPFDVWGIGAVGWSFGDGGSGAGPSTSHTYSTAGDFNVTALASDLVGNSTSVVRTVHVTAPPLPVPVLGKSVLVQVLRGKVYIATPANVHLRAKLSSLVKPPRGYTKLQLLRGPTLVPVRSLLDTSRGVVRITAARNSTSSQLQAGDFSLGAFTVTQGTTSPLTTAVMTGGGNFSTGCRGVKGASVAASRARPHRSLFANVHGRFSTRGRNSTATVRGTAFLTKDTCTSTLTKVTRGTVYVRDLRKNKTVKVKAHHSYLALVHPKGH